MAALARRAGLAWLALRELGPRPLGWLALYRFGLATGHYRRSTPARPLESFSAAPPRRVFPKRHPAAPLVLPPEGLLEEAAEILSGRVRLFGGEPVPLQLTPPGQPRHWTRYEGAPLPPGVEDLKFIWEPARFDWAFTLVRAAAARPSEAYAQFFWDRLAEFAAANPPNLGLNWLSAQEVALRLAALLFAGEFFTDHYPILPERQALWARCVRAHAARLRPTLPYARAQQNNHLTSEALGLFLGGLVLDDAPMRDLGWRTLNQALLQQTAASGEYAQNSLNYHRVALQTALLADCAARNAGPRWVPAVRQRLAAAAGWLCAQLDPASGRAPNLGSNDGAYPFPLAPGGFADYRPTAQAACVAFEGAPGLPPGPWDEALSWLGLSAQSAPRPCASPAVHRLDASNSWATLRAARFFSRPSHADQLHVDLWWCGVNLARDAGTYRYTAALPWDNRLSATAVHNTVQIDGQDQMLRAGKFLWLRRASATVTEKSAASLTAHHDGYAALGIRCRRMLARISESEWEIRDEILPLRAAPAEHEVRLHWLLPDWPFELHANTLSLTPPAALSSAPVRLEFSTVPALPFQIHLTRAGQPLTPGAPAHPNAGWFSPTYSVREPALSVSLVLRAAPSLELITRWVLPR